MPLHAPITVLLAEDHTVVREGLRSLLEAHGGFTVVGEAASGREAVRLVAKLRPAVVVLDVAMPLLNGFEATHQILQADPAARILILSAHSDDEYVERAVALGVAGYLSKQSSATMLGLAIREVMAGRAFFSPGIARRRLHQLQRSRIQGRPASAIRVALTSRENEVLQRVAEGGANKQIAAELGISIKTVEKHRQQVMDKLAIHDTAGLTRYAMSKGLIESGAPESSSPTRRAEP